MEKRIGFYEFQSVKSVAKACAPHQRKLAKLRGQIEQLMQEYKGEEAQVEAIKSGIEGILGITINELVRKDGNEYVPTDKVKYDATTKQYVFNDGESETTEPNEVPESPEPAPQPEPTDEPETPSEQPEQEQPTSGDDNFPF